MFGKKPVTAAGIPSKSAPVLPPTPAAPEATKTPALTSATASPALPVPPSAPAAPGTPVVSAAPVAAAASAEPMAAKSTQAVVVTAPVEAAVPKQQQAISTFTDPSLVTPDFVRAKELLVKNLLDQINFDALERIPKEVRKSRISATVETLIKSVNAPLTAAQTVLMKADLLNEMLGFGPIEVLMADADVSDIMINGHKQVYIEKHGKILLSDITFTSEKHLLNTIQKIVTLAGRRIDEISPMVDARMPDGSRFNAIIPPLALDGSIVSIRKFKKNKMPLSAYIGYGSMSPEMAKFLEICGHIRLNIIVSGGTGSGKTTLLNALSGNIDPGERVITIEDAAELLLHQPHVLRLETRPPNMEGNGEVNQRQLVKNALRMRPDRIILGEIRGDEVLDVLAAMNTGHDGSMATIHSNTPRDCLSRIENLVSMAGLQMPLVALRTQITSAVQLIVQIARMRDGARRITQIEEVVKMEGDIITTQTLFGYQSGPMDTNGRLTGKFYCTGVRPRFLSQAEYFNRDKEMVECLNIEKFR
jgi:pilus assembly protein CpaF